MNFASAPKWIVPAFLLLIAPSRAAVILERAPATLPGGYQLVWSDEFAQEPDGLPDPNKWIYEEGFIRNHEAQYYTKARPENARIEHGQLIIEERKDSVPNTAPEKNLGDKLVPVKYTSASITTEGKASWTYGRIEVRAKLPAGSGVWPAIWTLGTDIRQVGWPKCGEIDILELFGWQPGVVHGTIHYFANGRHASSGKSLAVPDTNTAFHVYAAEWTPDRIAIFVDDKKYQSFDVTKANVAGENPFRKPHFLILNLALGGVAGGHIDDSIFPQRMVVDYVRVYQKGAPAP